MAKKELSYRELSEELDDIVGSLQTEDVDVDEAIKRYERGMAIVKELEAYITEAENKISRVKKAKQ